MELIVEIINRSGRMLKRRKLNGESISIGRAYDNCLILDDPSVNPHHVSIQTSSEHDFLVRDLASVNGLIHNGKNIKDNVLLNSGDEFVLGKTHLRIYKLDYPVDETVIFDSVDGAVDFFSRNTVVIGAVLLATLLIVLEVWNGTISEMKAQDFFETISTLYITAITVALFWGLIGRVVKHEMFFKMQLSLILLYIALAMCMQFLHQVVLFNTMNYAISTSLYVVIECVVLTTLFWLNLRIATNQANSQRWVSAAILSVGVVMFSFSSEFFSRINFSESPNFVSALKPPLLRIVSGVALEDFLQNGEVIYSHDVKRDNQQELLIEK